ncbi:efflux RND transporter permease subunit [Escherichia coli]|uniref:efflux RND transporter permease subunit n=1 Tax=Escherichia coli TaxID=562 RepID=UPI003AB95C78|nr:efflux RND transporter permease subunit [Escherichia coli]
MIAGGWPSGKLPIAQYRQFAPSRVANLRHLPRCRCPDRAGYGHQGIEQNMNGIDNLMYMSSTSDSAGSVPITLHL